MAAEANKPLDADEISEGDLQTVAGGSSLVAPEIKKIENLTGEGRQHSRARQRLAGT